MKKILFVEDEAVISRIYCQKLAYAGFEVALAEDGLVAMKRLADFKPDLVVLDLLMPRFSGADVLKFIRQHPELKRVRVIVFSNSFLSHLVEQVSALGVDRTLVKAAVTPDHLIEIIHSTLNSSPGPAAGSPRPAPAAAVAATPASPLRELLEQAPELFRDLRQLCRDFLDAAGARDEPQRLTLLNRKIGSLTQMAGMAGWQRTAELSSALEALLFEMLNKPAIINDSSRHTVASGIAVLAGRFEQPDPALEQQRPSESILVVDDDAVSNRAVVHALGRAKLNATSVADPLEALRLLEQNRYDVVLLDIEMPGMDGLVLCEKMRALPLHKQTPVIFVTGHTDFPTRSRSILSGGNDLITKPIAPIELCVKVVAHLLKTPG